VDPVPLLDLKAQYAPLATEIQARIAEVVREQTFVLGPIVERFEGAIAAYTGSAHAIGCASGTDALILSLAAVGVGDGDRVLTSPFSFFASASCAYKVGARPQFADIDAATFNLDPQKVAEAMTSETRAMLPVHLFGQCAAMDELSRLAADRDVVVIEDAAQALGATYKSRRAGAVGRAGCYSFFPTKNLGGFGDGGMIVTDDDALADKLRLLRVHGGKQMYHHRWVGWNSRLDALQAAVLEVKLAHLDRWSAGRAENAARYDAWFAESGVTDDGQVTLPKRFADSSHIFNQYTLRVTRRDELRAHLNAAGIGHSVYYPVPLHLQECFAELGYAEGDFPVAEQACREVVSLPIFPELERAQQRRVVDSVVEFYRGG